MQRSFIDVIKSEHKAGLLGVGETEYRGIAAFALHHFAGGVHCGLPILEYVGEALSVLGHIAEYSEGDLGQHAEGALRAHHYLVEVRACRLAGVVARDDLANGSCVFLRENYIGNATVICAVLTRASRDDPAADAAVFKRLREVAAGVGSLRAEIFDRLVESFLKAGAAHTGLNGDGLVDLVEADDLVVALTHIH